MKGAHSDDSCLSEAVNKQKGPQGTVIPVVQQHNSSQPSRESIALDVCQGLLFLCGAVGFVSGLLVHAGIELSPLCSEWVRVLAMAPLSGVEMLILMSSLLLIGVTFVTWVRADFESLSRDVLPQRFDDAISTFFPSADASSAFSAATSVAAADTAHYEEASIGVSTAC